MNIAIAKIKALKQKDKALYDRWKPISKYNVGEYERKFLKF